jgi:Bacterial regulatory helix-turn-helix protein, lysR family
MGRAMGNRRPNQNWDDLRYFLAVARTGTLSAAAKQLGTEHTTVARHIQALEDELNCRLFHKSHSGYGLTDAGERLLSDAEAIESAYVFANAAASSEGQTIIGAVRIGVPDGFGNEMSLRPVRFKFGQAIRAGSRSDPALFFFAPWRLTFQQSPKRFTRIEADCCGDIQVRAVDPSRRVSWPC